MSFTRLYILFFAGALILPSCRHGNNRICFNNTCPERVNGEVVNEFQEHYVSNKEGEYRELLIPKVLASKENEQFVRVGYLMSYNQETKCPNWVAWHLTKEHTDGQYPRSGVPYFDKADNVFGIGQVDSYILWGKYFVDMEVDAPRQEHEDWREKPDGMSHGHICPAGDNKWSKEAMNQSFLLTNMCPQTEKLNGGGWKKLEEKCRDWAIKNGDIYIVAGPIFYNGVRRSFGKNKIGIPDAFFKVVLCVNGKPKAIGFVYSNDDSSHPMDKCVCSVDEVEEITGFDFFSSLPDSIEDDIESQCKLKDW